jgi:hypothetical protein
MDLTKVAKAKLLSGATAMAKVQSMNDVSLFFDHGGKRTRDRRETIGAESEFFVETIEVFSILDY